MGRMTSLAPIFCDASFVSGSNISHSSNTGPLSSGLWRLWHLISYHLPPLHLPPPCAQSLERFLFAQRNLCTGLCVCLACPTSSPFFGESLLVLQDQLKCQPVKSFPWLSSGEKVNSFPQMLHRIVLRKMNSAVMQPGVKFRLCYLLALCPWASYLTSLYLGFLDFKMEIIIIGLTSLHCYED